MKIHNNSTSRPNKKRNKKVTYPRITKVEEYKKIFIETPTDTLTTLLLL